MTKDQVREVWAIELESGVLVPPIDDDASDSFIAFSSEADAQLCLESQLAKGYIDNGKPVRLL